MTASAYPTPRPWRFDIQRGAIVNSAGESVAVVCFHGADSLAQENANGHLIAQAPELLRVARLALEELELFPAIRHTKTLRDDLHRVIAAATGTGTATQHTGA
jgi:hypothetical protein